MKSLGEVLATQVPPGVNGSSMTGPPPPPEEPTCPVCGDAGFCRVNVPLGHPDWGKAVPCQNCRDLCRERIASRLAISGLPLLTQHTHRFRTWKNLAHLRPVAAACKAFAAGSAPHHFLTLIGRPGTGKTHLALAAAWDWLEEDRGTVAYYQVETLLDTLRRGYDRDLHTGAEDTYRVLHFVTNCDLLVLDDLGAEQPTEWAGAKLDEIVDHRYINRRPLIITSNLGRDSLPQRISDRLSEGQVLILKTGSYRRQAQKETPDEPVP